VLRMLGVPGNESARLAAEAGQADQPERAERSESQGGSS
jgi:hypothetical protein